MVLPLLTILTVFPLPLSDFCTTMSLFYSSLGLLGIGKSIGCDMVCHNNDFLTVIKG